MEYAPHLEQILTQADLNIFKLDENVCKLIRFGRYPIEKVDDIIETFKQQYAAVEGCIFTILPVAYNYGTKYVVISSTPANEIEKRLKLRIFS